MYAKLPLYPYVCKMTFIPLGLILSEKHDELNLYDVCHECISVAWGHGLYYGGSVLVAMPQIICSGGPATYICSGGIAIKYLYLVTLSHFLYLAAMLHISVACSGWVGRVVSPHGERMVWGCMWLDMVGFLHKHDISVLVFSGPTGLILISVLG